MARTHGSGGGAGGGGGGGGGGGKPSGGGSPFSLTVQGTPTFAGRVLTARGQAKERGKAMGNVTVVCLVLDGVEAARAQVAAFGIATIVLDFDGPTAPKGTTYQAMLALEDGSAQTEPFQLSVPTVAKDAGAGSDTTTANLGKTGIPAKLELSSAMPEERLKDGSGKTRFFLRVQLLDVNNVGTHWLKPPRSTTEPGAKADIISTGADLCVALDELGYSKFELDTEKPVKLSFAVKGTTVKSNELELKPKDSDEKFKGDFGARVTRFVNKFLGKE